MSVSDSPSLRETCFPVAQDLLELELGPAARAEIQRTVEQRLADAYRMILRSTVDRVGTQQQPPQDTPRAEVAPPRPTAYLDSPRLTRGPDTGGRAASVPLPPEEPSRAAQRPAELAEEETPDPWTAQALRDAVTGRSPRTVHGFGEISELMAATPPHTRGLVLTWNGSESAIDPEAETDPDRADHVFTVLHHPDHGVVYLDGRTGQEAAILPPAPHTVGFIPLNDTPEPEPPIDAPRTLPVTVVSAGVGVGLPGRYGWVGRVNPFREAGGEFLTNCVLVAIAVDLSLAEGAVFVAPPSGWGEEGVGPAGGAVDGLTVFLGCYRDVEPYPVAGVESVVEAMLSAAPGQRGMVVRGSASGGIAHVINVVRDDEAVVFLDGQSGDLAPLPTDALSFLPTTHDIPGYPLGSAERASTAPARPIRVGAIGTETEFQFPLILDEKGKSSIALSYGTVLAYYTSLRSDEVEFIAPARALHMPQIKVDSVTIFLGKKGAAALSSNLIREMTGKEPTGEQHIKIPELVLPPMQVLSDEGNRFRPQRGMELRDSVQKGLARANASRRPIPLEKALGPGWVLTEAGRSLLVGKALTGPGHPAYTQYTVGVTLGGLSTTLRSVAQNLPEEFSNFAPILGIGRQFAEEVVGNYARSVIGDFGPNEIAFLGSIAGLEELRGYAWLVFEHVVAEPVATVYLETISKVAVPALSRVPFREIHEILPETVKTFLAREGEKIEDIFVEHLNRLVENYPSTSHPASELRGKQLLARRIAVTGNFTMSDYLWSALLGESGEALIVDQSDIFGISDFELDNNSGRLGTPLILLELRNYGKGLTTPAEMGKFVHELSHMSQRTFPAASFSQNTTPSRAAASILAHPLVKSLIRVFENVAHLEQLQVPTLSAEAREYLAHDVGAAVVAPSRGISEQTLDMLKQWEAHFARLSGTTAAPSVPKELLAPYTAMRETLRETRKAAERHAARRNDSRLLGAPIPDRPGAPSPTAHDVSDRPVPVVSAGVGVGLPGRYGWVGRVNPFREAGGEFLTNCVLVAIAVDLSLAEGAVFVAPPSGWGEEGVGPAGGAVDGLTVFLGCYRDVEPYPVAGVESVVEAMLSAAPGQRGMVVRGSASGGIAHVINVVRDDEAVVFLDGQSGNLAPLPTDALSFLPTTHDIPGYPLDPAHQAATATAQAPAPAVSETRAVPAAEPVREPAPWRAVAGASLPSVVVQHPQWFDLGELVELGSSESTATEAVTDPAAPAVLRALPPGTLEGAADEILRHMATVSANGITMANADLILKAPDKERLPLWMAMAQALANKLRHRMRVALPIPGSVMLEVCPSKEI
ncbi:toxin glutamine deamidase domain-containing protein [Streptomyces sp. NPDC088923]|uniref:toxin glutamine deamidase domain-containing protein n=1 Tax=Streptomyces sp. NPDC088923 TaxID=3365913 RepID=UPI00380A9EE6